VTYYLPIASAKRLPRGLLSKCHSSTE